MPLDVVANRMAEDPLHRGPMMPVQFNAFYHFILLGLQSNPGHKCRRKPLHFLAGSGSFKSLSALGPRLVGLVQGLKLALMCDSSVNSVSGPWSGVDRARRDLEQADALRRRRDGANGA